MSTDDGLAQVLDGRVTGDFATFLRRRFSVFRVIDGHDSQCISYGVRDGRGGAWFVKHSTTAWANGILERARLVHAAVSHPAIIPLRGAIQTDTGLALVYPWVAGVCLNENGDRSGRDRFRRLPVSAILAALGQVYDAHLAAAAAGLVAVDLYDGCLIYDFDTARLWLCDLDE